MTPADASVLSLTCCLQTCILVLSVLSCPLSRRQEGCWAKPGHIGPSEPVWSCSQETHTEQMEAYCLPLFPEVHSVNDGISANLCSLTYTAVDEASRSLIRIPGWPIFDLMGAFRTTPMIGGCWACTGRLKLM